MRETPTQVPGGRRSRPPYEWEVTAAARRRRERRVTIAFAISLFVVGSLLIGGLFFT